MFAFKFKVQVCLVKKLRKTKQYPAQPCCKAFECENAMGKCCGNLPGGADTQLRGKHYREARSEVIHTVKYK